MRIMTSKNSTFSGGCFVFTRTLGQTDGRLNLQNKPQVYISVVSHLLDLHLVNILVLHSLTQPLFLLP